MASTDLPKSELLAVVRDARALLERVDNITTDEFRLGGEKAEREALRASLEKLDAIA